MTTVSAIIPARGRREWARGALACALSQTHRLHEILILDDDDDPSFDDAVAAFGSPVQYFSTPVRWNIGAKRNFLCERATGDVIAHFDTDDWYAPERIQKQIAMMEAGNLAVVGFHSALFYDVTQRRFGRWQAHNRYYGLGSSLIYRRDYWRSHVFGDQQIGEDSNFVRTARNDGRIQAMPGEKLMVARVHPGNTCRKDFKSYRAVLPWELPEDFPFETGGRA